MSLKHLKTGDANPVIDPDVVRVYSMRYCPFAQRALLVLAQKGIQPEIVNCSLNEKPEFLMERNPSGTVPVLEYKGNVVPESLIVANLLEELYPEKPLWSKDPFQRAMGRLLIEKFGPVISGFYSSFRDPDSEEKKDAFKKALLDYEGRLKAKKTPFFGGQNYDMVDLMVWPWVERTMMMDESLFDPLPDLKAWANRMASLPVAKATAIPKEEMVDFYTNYFINKAVYN